MPIYRNYLVSRHIGEGSLDSRFDSLQGIFYRNKHRKQAIQWDLSTVSERRIGIYVDIHWTVSFLRNGVRDDGYRAFTPLIL
jgi:hypothetical protein